MNDSIPYAYIAALDAQDEEDLRVILASWRSYLWAARGSYESREALYASPWCRLFAYRVDELVQQDVTHFDDRYAMCRNRAIADCRKAASEAATLTARQNTESQ